MATPIEQLELMKNLKENFDGYGGFPPSSSVLDLAKEFVRLIDKIQKRVPRFDGVFVTPGPDGGVLIEWDDDTFEHELEVNFDGSIGLLHEEKSSGVMVNRTFKPSQFSVTPGLLTELFDTVTV